MMPRVKGGGLPQGTGGSNQKNPQVNCLFPTVRRRNGLLEF
jgi:hypothetical protein